MQDQPNLSVSETEAQLDRGVLNLVLSEHPWPWRIDEIARELDNEANAEDAVCRLTASGLLHRVGEFVFPTRTASRAAEIEVGTV
jgi:hypothetical protein